MFQRLVHYCAICLMAAALLTSTVYAESSKIVQRHPNIIFILADDLGYGDLGSYGQEKIRTPNLDRIAAEGMRFTQFYSGSTVCRPARCTLMTGLHTGHCYVRANTTGLDLRPNDITIAEMLKNEKYKTAIIGKWALGEENSTGIPNRQGFDYFYGYLNQTHAHNSYPEFLIENTEKVSLENTVPDPGPHGQGVATVRREYSNDLFTEKALNFIRKNKDSSFFLYLPFTIPHANNEAGISKMGLEVPSLGIYKDMDWPYPQKAYAAMVTRLDSYVGNIVTELKRQGIENNTIVFFSSDNGPHKEGGFNPDFFDSNSSFRGIKRDLYEGGIRVPLIVWGPTIVKSNSVTNHISYFPDIFTTIADIIDARVEHHVDGISFYPILTGAEDNQEKHEFLYWEFHEHGGSKALRTGNYKSVIRPYGGKMELYDLTSDISEQTDISSSNDDIKVLHTKILEQEHTDLPLIESIKVYLARERITKKKVLLVAVLIIGALLAIGYAILFKRRMKVA